MGEKVAEKVDAIDSGKSCKASKPEHVTKQDMQGDYTSKSQDSN